MVNIGINKFTFVLGLSYFDFGFVYGFQILWFTLTVESAEALEFKRKVLSQLEHKNKGLEEIQKDTDALAEALNKFKQYVEEAQQKRGDQ